MKKINRQSQIGGLDAACREIAHLGGAGKQHFPEAASLGSQVDVYLAAIMRIAHAFDETATLHTVQGRNSRRLHHADTLTEFALSQTVFVPQCAKEKPLSHAYTMGGDLCLERARERAMDIANHISNAVVGWGNGLAK
ncbi:hypothetical protein N826_15640 [Skermanella aerolata KACC 11604]|nr:hypothetical protein N826_15640 [Skermanella aerolata KACC 11604]